MEWQGEKIMKRRRVMNDLKDLKAKMTKDIENAIKDFENTTGLSVMDINMNERFSKNTNLSIYTKIDLR